MGEEWGADDAVPVLLRLPGELAEAVRDGRRREFAAFFERTEDVPDPLAEATFARSRLDWSELDASPHTRLGSRHTRSLLGCARGEIAPRLGRGRDQLAGVDVGRRPHGLELSWRLGDGSRLTLLANLGRRAVDAGDWRRRADCSTPPHDGQPAGGCPAWSGRLGAACDRGVSAGDRASPRATYRLQLRGGMDFARAAASCPTSPGSASSHLYLSPPFTARPGSTHGYDVVDPNRLDPELGGEAGFMRRCAVR